MKAQKFIIKSPHTYEDKKTNEEKTRWVSIGVAFLNQDRGGKVEDIRLRLDALPFSSDLRAWPAESPEAED